jgi:hypothetical protein
LSTGCPAEPPLSESCFVLGLRRQVPRSGPSRRREQSRAITAFSASAKCANSGAYSYRHFLAVIGLANAFFSEQCFLVGPITAIREVGADSSEGYFRKTLDELPAAIDVSDALGHITYFNEAAATLWGHRPTIGTSEWCGSWKLFWPDGRALPHGECPMAIAIKERRSVRGMEAVAERPHARAIRAIPDASFRRFWCSHRRGQYVN